MSETLDSEVLKQGTALFNLLHRHFVALRFQFRKGGERASEIYSAFLLSVSDEWVLVTAGHCIDGIRKIESAGYKLDTCDLIDGLASDSRYRHPIPFDYFDADPISLDGEGFDCGILRLNYNQRQLLEANGKAPLTEEVWYKQPSKIDLLLLVGIPSELTREDAHATYLSPSIHIVTEVERDEPFTPTPLPTFYGRVELGNDLKSIKGMSGGPIFAFRVTEADTRYWLHALQSGWNSADRRIAAPRTKDLGLMISYVIEKSGGARSLRNAAHRA